MGLVEEWMGTLTALCFLFYRSIIDSDKISEYDFKLMDIDSEHLGIPDTTYDAVMSSVRFRETVRDIQQIKRPR